jgi:hypothetical protein
MPHTSFLRNHGKTARPPRRPFEKERLDNEMKLIGEFGLKNKREVWRTQLTLARIRKAARVLLTLEEKDPKRLFEGGALLRYADAALEPARRAERVPALARMRVLSLAYAKYTPSAHAIASLVGRLLCPLSAQSAAALGRAR